MFQGFTDRARKVTALATLEAQRLNHEYVGTEHVLLSLINEGSGIGANVLKNLKIDSRKVSREVNRLVKRGPKKIEMGKMPQTPRVKQVVEDAILQARSLNHAHVGTEHLLLGLMQVHDGIASHVLRGFGLDTNQVRDEVVKVLGNEGDDRDSGVL